MQIDYTHANASFLPWGYKFTFLFKRVLLAAYYPPFLERLLAMKTRLAEQGVHCYSLYGYRSRAQQADMRKLWLAGKGGKAAPEGLSAHQYGLADDTSIDADLGTPGLQPTWEAARYEPIGVEAARAGLVWGKSFGDRPHVQYPGFVSGAQLTPLSAFWQKLAGTEDERLRAVWSYIGALPAPTAPVYNPIP